MKIDMIVKKEFLKECKTESRGRLLYTSPIRVQIFLTKKKKTKEEDDAKREARRRNERLILERRINGFACLYFGEEK